MENESATEALKNAIIAEIASDVLHIKDDVAELGPIISQLKESLPQLFDLLKSGMIETLDTVNKGILDAGGERVDFVKGQLHSYIEQAFAKALESNTKEIDALQAKFTKQHTLALEGLKSQYEQVSSGMTAVLSSSRRPPLPTWATVAITLVIVVCVVASGAVCWQLASYKEAVYMQAFLKHVEDQKVNPPKPLKTK